MSRVIREHANTLSVEWRQYAGGPMSTVTDVTITITPLSGGAAVIGPTATGVTNPATGINIYSWTPAVGLALVDYLISWSGTDPESETVTATEIVTLDAGAVTGGPYATRAQLKRRMGIPDAVTTQDTDVDDALLSASDTIHRYCGRQFGRVDVASARSFLAGPSGVDVDDFWTTDDLLIDGVAYDASSTSYALEPANGIRDGVSGWPYERIAYSILWALPTWPYGGVVVAVTARWGWEAVPANIKDACLLLAADDLKSKDAPFGVAGFGDYVVRVRANPKAKEKLDPYAKWLAKVG